MKRSCLVTCLLLVAIVLPALLYCRGSQNPPGQEEVILLPRPRWSGSVSVEEAMQQRRTVRDYADSPLSLEDLSQLLWSAQGITSAGGLRTAPSAGALYPLEVYVMASRVAGLDPGMYHYIPGGHKLSPLERGDLRKALSDASPGQSQVMEAAASILITGVYARTTEKYGERGIRYVHMEAGHAGQNVLLQAQSLGLGACPVGAFEDDRLKALLSLPRAEDPLYILCIGKMGQP